MSARYAATRSGDFGLSDLPCNWQRIFDGRQAPYLVSINAPMFFGGKHYQNLSIQCRAVVDDFGDLVPVTEWA